jgi:hypothetical protein
MVYFIKVRNNKGLDMTLIYYNKFDIISPCYFDIKPEVMGGKFNSKIDGSNYINTDYIEELKEKKSDIKIIPRFICSEFNNELYKLWLDDFNMENFLKIFIRRMK